MSQSELSDYVLPHGEAFAVLTSRMEPVSTENDLYHALTNPCVRNSYRYYFHQKCPLHLGDRTLSPLETATYLMEAEAVAFRTSSDNSGLKNWEESCRILNSLVERCYLNRDKVQDLLGRLKKDSRSPMRPSLNLLPGPVAVFRR